jgi:peptide/nickel transport system permease protein
VLLFARAEPLIVVSFVLLLIFVLLAIFAYQIAPYDPDVRNYDENRRLLRLHAPSSQHLLGTTYYGGDVLSQTIVGTRVSVIVGLVSALITTVLGTTIGLVAGYFGRWVDTLLMRLTDIAYGTPVLAFAIILVALSGPNLANIIIVISVLLWRTTARTIRAQVISIKRRPFILAARASGASHLRIIIFHVLPNVASLALLYAALGVGDAVLAEAGLSFLGLGDPLHVSWGQMLHFAFLTASVRHAWWWVVPPGLCISLFVMASYLAGRSYERILNPRLEIQNEIQ